MRTIQVFPIQDKVFWKKQLLHWAAGHEFAVYLDSNEHSQAVTSSHSLTSKGWKCLVAIGAVSVLQTNNGQAFEQLSAFREDKKGDWLFGFFGYDLKNETERLSSQHFDGIGLPDMGFFQPETVVGIKGDQIEIQTLVRMPEEVFEELKLGAYPSRSFGKGGRGEVVPNATETSPLPPFPKLREGYAPSLALSMDKHATPAKPVILQPRIPKAEYLQKVEAIRRHIVEGDLYEMNLCQEFFAENAALDPVAVFERLNEIGKAPFAAFMRWRDRYLLSASPERFLKKEGRKLISQPIKGTRKRGNSPEEDAKIRQELADSEKDRAENVMIVDLVRNDLARNCVPGSVKVEELFGIYTFETVHQMISTVRGMLPIGSIVPIESIVPIDTIGAAQSNQSSQSEQLALRDAFPPGSMTGAPKVMAMELIEKYEKTRRGLYAGSVGYFDPNGDFDFNVVIRSILYNAATGYVSVQVGGAIVFDSVPEEEYEECLVKAGAMMSALSGSC